MLPKPVPGLLFTFLAGNSLPVSVNHCHEPVFSIKTGAGRGFGVGLGVLLFFFQPKNVLSSIQLHKEDLYLAAQILA